MKKRIVSNLLLLLVAVIWGFAFVAQVAGSEALGPLTLNGVRFTLGLISLLPVVLIFEKGRTSKEERKYTLKASIITGLVLFTAITLQQYGIVYTMSAGVSSFITGLYMIFVPMTYFLFFRKRIGAQVWVGALVALLGVFLLCYDPNEGFSFGIGEILLLLGSFFWTAHVILIDKFGKNVRSLHYSWGQFAVCAVLGLASAFIFEDITLSALWTARYPLLYAGVLSVGVAYTLQVVAQKNADPNYAVIILSTESVFGAVGGVIFGTDSIPMLGYFGCVLMFVGIICSQIEPSMLNKAKNKAQKNHV